MSNITKFYQKNSGKNPDLVLEQAIGIYKDVLILGWDKEENLDFRCNTTLSHNEILWLVAKFKHKLLNGDFSD